MKRLVLVIGALFSYGLAAETFQANAQYCLVCHGSNAQGNAAIQAPNLTVLPEWYLQAQLHSFQAGWRGDHAKDNYSKEMMAVAKSMEPKDVDMALAFIKGLQPVAAVAETSGDIAKGRSLYQSCQSCHGAEAQGNETMKAPPLAGQHAWYLSRQLESFRAGERGVNAADQQGALMRQMALGLSSSQDVQDVVAYISSINQQKDNQ